MFGEQCEDVAFPVGRGLAVALRVRELRRSHSRRPEQVFNARHPLGSLVPVSEAPADAVKAAWSPLLPGQDVPLLWEDRP